MSFQVHKSVGRGRAIKKTEESFKITIKNDVNNNNVSCVDDDGMCKICDRPDMIVFCKNCGHEWRGRKKIQCPMHPKTVMLMDSSVCPMPGCNSSDLKEI